jgi:hypothetical protein
LVGRTVTSPAEARAQQVLGRGDPEDTELTAVIGRISVVAADDPPLSFEIPITRQLHPRARDWLAGLVGDRSRDDGARRQGQIDTIEYLTVRDFDRPSLFERPPLTIFNVNVAGFRRLQPVAPGGQLRELVAAVVTGRRDARLSILNRHRHQADLHAPQGSVRVRGYDAAPDHATDRSRNG